MLRGHRSAGLGCARLDSAPFSPARRAEQPRRGGPAVWPHPRRHAARAHWRGCQGRPRAPIAQRAHAHWATSREAGSSHDREPRPYWPRARGGRGRGSRLGGARAGTARALARASRHPNHVRSAYTARAPWRPRGASRAGRRRATPPREPRPRAPPRPRPRSARSRSARLGVGSGWARLAWTQPGPVRPQTPSSFGLRPSHWPLPVLMFRSLTAGDSWPLLRCPRSLVLDSVPFSSLPALPRAPQPRGRPRSVCTVLPVQSPCRRESLVHKCFMTGQSTPQPPSGPSTGEQRSEITKGLQKGSESTQGTSWPHGAEGSSLSPSLEHCGSNNQHQPQNQHLPKAEGSGPSSSLAAFYISAL